MRFLSLLPVVAFAGLTAARSGQHVGKQLPHQAAKRAPAPQASAAYGPNEAEPKFLTDKTQKYVVNGTAIPDVPFDIGESYAGLLPITDDKDEERQFYFWFFPSTNPNATEEITIWLNGGPGCSSLEGLLQENGPFIWQYGSGPAATKNPYTWVNLTNIVWVEQPIGTGFNQFGNITATSEEDVADQFLSFFKVFLDTFDWKNKKVYITGESYAGYYVPYIADAMYKKDDKEYYDVEAIMIYDPSTSTDTVQEQIPAVAYVDYFAPLFAFNESFMADIHNRSEFCNYTSFLNDYLVFPPNGPLPNPPNASVEGCDLWDDILTAALDINPCFDIYEITTTCPLLWDVLGFPGSFDYVVNGTEIYFDREDVKKAINAPVNVTWMECTNNDVFIDNVDNSPPSGLSILPGVIEKNKRTVIGHGMLDYILIANGTLLMIQNMTFNGAQGFTEAPSDPFLVPFHSELSDATLAGAGTFGRTRTERGLTFVEVNLSGHMIPQYAPSAAYRMMEYLLGRVDSLSSEAPFTTQ
ncbi:MAG: hypothetical protein M4579_004346 [Chaenotheca gracillima]|nr:MAG: hypothetical protein M4579_004346 [Chaenotheca gracillima]